MLFNRILGQYIYFNSFLLFVELVLFCLLKQVHFSFRLAFRRSSVYCDENTVRSKGIIGSGGYWQAVSSRHYTSNIANARFQCTDYSAYGDWSSGENSFNYSFSHAGPWLVRLVLYIHKLWSKHGIAV